MKDEDKATLSAYSAALNKVFGATVSNSAGVVHRTEVTHREHGIHTRHAWTCSCGAQSKREWGIAYEASRAAYAHSQRAVRS